MHEELSQHNKDAQDTLFISQNFSIALSHRTFKIAAWSIIIHTSGCTSFDRFHHADNSFISKLSKLWK